MPNKARASFDIKLNGSEYSLRPTFESIMEFEDKSGVDVFEALQYFTRGKIRAKIIVACVWAGIKGESLFQQQTDCPSFKEIGTECQNHGMEECVGFAIDYLSKAVASEGRLKKLEELEENQSD